MASNLCVKHEAKPLSTTKNEVTLGRAGQSAPRLSKASTLPDAGKLKGMLNTASPSIQVQDKATRTRCHQQCDRIGIWQRLS